MRLHTIVIISSLVGLNFSSAFAQSDRKASDEFFRENSAREATNAKLTEILRQKQSELDGGGNVAPGARPQPAAVPASGEVSLEQILRQKQAELDAAETPALRPQPALRPAMTAPARPVVAQPAVDAAAEQQLAEVLRKKQAELNAQQRLTAPPSATASKEMEESEKRVQKMEAEIRAKEEAIRKRAAAQSKSVESDATAKRIEAVNAAAQASRDRAATPAPVLDPGSKAGRLAELLRRYKADEITPQEYHMERAKIVAEP